MLEYIVGSSVESRAWSNYFASLFQSFGVTYPEELYEYQMTPSISLDITSVALVIILAMVVMWGVKESSLINSVLVVTKLVILFFFVIFALTKFNINNYKPLFPYGIEGTFKGAALVYFAFLGFDGVSSLAEETKNTPLNG